MSFSPLCWLDKSPLAQATTLLLPLFLGPWDTPSASGPCSSLKLDFPLLQACAFLTTGFWFLSGTCGCFCRQLTAKIKKGRP